MTGDGNEIAEESEAPENSQVDEAKTVIAARSKLTRTDQGRENAVVAIGGQPAGNNDPKAKRGEASETGYREAAWEEDLDPNNEHTIRYKEFKKNLQEDESLSGPVSNFILGVLAYLARYGQLFALRPGKYTEYISTDETLRNKRLSEEQLAKMLKGKKEKEGKERMSVDKKKFDQDRVKREPIKEKLSGTEVEKISTRYVTQSLWGIDDINGPDDLAARLTHTKKVEPHRPGEFTPYYTNVGQDALRAKQMPYGTIIVFAPEDKSEAGTKDKVYRRDKLVAFATGNDDEIRYYDPKKGEKIIKLSAPNSPLNGLFAFQMALRPNFDTDGEYFKKHPDQLNQRLDNSPKGKARQANSDILEIEKSLTSPEGVLTDLKSQKLARLIESDLLRVTSDLKEFDAVAGGLISRLEQIALLDAETFEEAKYIVSTVEIRRALSRTALEVGEQNPALAKTNQPSADNGNAPQKNDEDKKAAEPPVSAQNAIKSAGEASISELQKDCANSHANLARAYAAHETLLRKPVAGSIQEDLAAKTKKELTDLQSKRAKLALEPIKAQ